MLVDKGYRPISVEFARFVPVGLVTSAIDFGLLILLTEVFGVHYLVSTAVGFIAGQIWAYTMSVRWVFARCSARSHTTGFLIFFGLSTLGLAVTELLMWQLTENLGLHYFNARVVSSLIVFGLLFVARKRILFR